MIMYIPEWNVKKFGKLLTSLSKKNISIKITDLGIEYKELNGKLYKCHKININDSIQCGVDGFKFVAVIEHTDNGNIIRNFSDIEVPEYYRTAPCKCDHCNKIRARKDTYIVHHKGEFKQVGKACLKEYTGISPADVAYTCSFEAELKKLEATNESVMELDRSAFLGYDSLTVKHIALNLIKKYGYTPTSRTHSTTESVIDLYGRKATERNLEEIAALDAWVETKKEVVTDYFMNATTAYSKEYYEARDLGLVTSLINCYVKETEMSKCSGFLGNEGDKVEFKITSDLVLYTINPICYGAGHTYAHKIIDSNNHVIIWKTGNSRIAEGSTVKATVKELSNYRGEDQTIITRGKIYEA